LNDPRIVITELKLDGVIQYAIPRNIDDLKPKELTPLQRENCEREEGDQGGVKNTFKALGLSLLLLYFFLSEELTLIRK
jgi:hypothetical protein